MKYTQQQQAAITTRARRICVDAGAGSGKTRVLIDRIVHLLETEAATLDEIVGITFTDKAAAEMRERLRAAFRKRVPLDNPEAATRWRELERRADHARVGTIHAFCAGVLRENALWLGLDPDFAVLTEQESLLLRRTSVRRTLQRLFEAKDPAALHLAAHLGSSRLEDCLLSLLKRAGDFVAPAAESPQELSAHWHETAAREYRHSLEALQHDPRISGFAMKLREFEEACLNQKDSREILRERMLEAFAIIQGGAAATEILPALGRLQEELPRASRKNWSGDSFDALSKLQTNIKQFVKDLCTAPECAPEVEEDAARLTLHVSAVFREVLASCAAEKQALNGLDFDDLIQHTREALRCNEEVRRRTAAGIRFLLIDEFQDTDGGQLEMARLLCDEPGGPELFVVGDVKQSVYYFRGAEVEVFRAVRRESNAVLPLDQNFRSLPGVLEFVNDFFRQSGLLSAVEAYQSMRCFRPPTGQHCIEFLVSMPDPASEGKRAAENARRDEARLIARRITACCHGDRPVLLEDEASGEIRPARYGDIALLFRRMSDVHLYERALQELGVPYSLVAGAGFYARQEIVDVLNVLKVVLDGWDEVALFGFLRSPMACLSDESLYRLARQGPLPAVFAEDTATLDDPEEAKRLGAARELVAVLRGISALPVATLLRRILDLTGYEAVLLSTHHGPRKVANVRKLLQLAESFARRLPPTLRAYMEYLDALRGEAIREGEAGLQPEGAGGVSLLTIHKSKGLEFPIVFIPDMGQGNRAPRSDAYCLHRELGFAMKTTDPDGEAATPVIGEAIKRRIDREEAAERARLLYVALTRARDFLVCCGAAEAGAGSWLERFDMHYGILARSDGDSFGGDAWRALLRTEIRAYSPTEAPAAAALAPLDTLLRRAAPIDAGQAPPPRTATVSVSALLDRFTDTLDSEADRDAYAEEPNVEKSSNDRAAAFARTRGTLVHRMFEVWDFAQASPPASGLLAESGLPADAHPALAHDMAAIARRFQESTLGERMAADARVLRETPFLLDLEGVLVSGTIDALLSDGTIVDYKTGQFHEAQNARYEWQLLLYAAALRELRGIVPATGMLYYVDADRMHSVLLEEHRIAHALDRARATIAQLLAERA